jgi:hypothetical protein
VTSTGSGRWATRDTVAGFLAASSVFLAALQLFYRPFRLAPVALILLLVATVMSRDEQQHKLIRLGFAVLGICFVAGTAIQVLTQHPLY